MKDKLLHLPNKGLKGLESFLLVFLCTYINMAFCFYIASIPLWSMTFLWGGKSIKINLAQIKKIVFPLGHYHTLWCLIDLKVYWYKGQYYFQYLTKRKFELRYNIKWKSWIQFIWHLTWQSLQKFWIFILHCLMKRDGVSRMFPFAKRNINTGWRYEPKND